MNGDGQDVISLLDAEELDTAGPFFLKIETVPRLGIRGAR
jgi:hypothetical protein